MDSRQDFQEIFLTKNINGEGDGVTVDRVPHFLVGKPLEDLDANESIVSLNVSLAT